MGLVYGVTRKWHLIFDKLFFKLILFLCIATYGECNERAIFSDKRFKYFASIC